MFCYKNKELFREIEEKPELILDIPSELLNYKIYEIAIQKKPSLLKNIPNSILNMDNNNIVKIALSIDGMAIQHVASKSINQELCDLASKNLHIKKGVEENEVFLSFVPFVFTTKRICLRAVKHNNMNIDYVPMVFLDDDVGEVLVSSDKQYLLDKVPLTTRRNLNKRG